MAMSNLQTSLTTKSGEQISYDVAYIWILKSKKGTKRTYLQNRGRVMDEKTNFFLG